MAGPAAPEHCPSDAGGLIDQRYGGEFGWLALQQLCRPAAGRVVLARQPHNRRGADDQQATEVTFALLADVDLTVLAAAAVRLRRRPEPSGELLVGSEQIPIRHHRRD